MEALDNVNISTVWPGEWSALAVVMSSLVFAAGHTVPKWLAALVYRFLISILWIIRKDLFACIIIYATTNLALTVYFTGLGALVVIIACLPLPFRENANIGKSPKCRFVPGFYCGTGGTKAWLYRADDLVIDPMAGGGVTPDTCLALGRRCWAFDMKDRPKTRPEIESHTWSNSPDQGLSWPVNSKEKSDLIIFDPPYFDKMAMVKKVFPVCKRKI